MVLLDGKFPKLGFFLEQLCLHTLELGGRLGRIQYNAFDSSSIARKTMVEMLYGAPQWEILQAWFLPCTIVSTYSTTMTKLMLLLLAPQLQEKQWWR